MKKSDNSIPTVWLHILIAAIPYSYQNNCVFKLIRSIFPQIIDWPMNMSVVSHKGKCAVYAGCYVIGMKNVCLVNDDSSAKSLMKGAEWDFF